MICKTSAEIQKMDTESMEKESIEKLNLSTEAENVDSEYERKIYINDLQVWQGDQKIVEMSILKFTYHQETRTHIFQWGEEDF